MLPCNKTHGISVPGGKTTSSVSDSKRAKGREAALKKETGSGPACLLIRLYLSFLSETHPFNNSLRWHSYAKLALQPTPVSEV